ncbi:OST5 family protein [Rhodotorula paludigena]|uniref:OST5 family protein n=1 Tax=Rhodotorula paludigena TaxID=86838 RepID=UPI0031714DF6
MSSTYAQLKAEHAALPAFEPFFARSALPSLATQALLAAFVLTFYFSTLRSKTTIPYSELAVAGLASIFGGFGLVFAFCAVGANV